MLLLQRKWTLCLLDPGIVPYEILPTTEAFFFSINKRVFNNYDFIGKNAFFILWKLYKFDE